jgi:myotubularin-related protein 9
MSPVFIMFLDCVWQCLQQYPCAFEFNEAFLLAMAEHSQASRYGTFLFDCQKDREAAGLSEKTLSFWGFCDIPEELRRFKNVFYEPLPGWIKPSFRPQSIQVWLALYGAGTPYLEFHDEVHELLMFLKDKHDTAKEEIELKQTELADLEAKVAAAGLA